MPLFLLQAFTTTNATNASIVTGAVRLGNDAATALSHVNWSAPSWDLFIVLFFLITVFLYGLSLGRDRVIVILVTIYMALAVVSNAPYIGRLDKIFNVGETFAFRAVIFFSIFFLLFVLLSRSALVRTFGGLGAGKWWQVLVFSTFHVGLLISITLSFLPPSAIAQLSPLTREVFASDMGRFFWIVAPILGMVVLKVEPQRS
jgi:hypothetical protein